MSTHVHQCGSLQRAREKEGIEVDLVFYFGISLSMSIDSILSVSLDALKNIYMSYGLADRTIRNRIETGTICMSLSK